MSWEEGQGRGGRWGWRRGWRAGAWGGAVLQAAPPSPSRLLFALGTAMKLSFLAATTLAYTGKCDDSGGGGVSGPAGVGARQRAAEIRRLKEALATIAPQFLANAPAISSCPIRGHAAGHDPSLPSIQVAVAP